MSVLLPTVVPVGLVNAFNDLYSKNKFDEARSVLEEFVPAAYLNNDGYLLCEAAKKGDLDKVRFLLRNHVEVDKPNYGRRPLYFAAANGCVEVVRELLACGAEVDADEPTALHAASMNGHKAVIDLLLENHAQIAKTSNGDSYLYLACYFGHYDAYVTLVEHGARIEDTLLVAAERGHDAIVSYIIEKKADWNTREKRSRTPLYYACKNNRTSTAKILCQKGAHLDLGYDYSGEINDINRTALMIAAENDNEELVRFFVAQGADIYQKDIWRRTAEGYAKSDRIRTFFAEKRKELRYKWVQEQIACAKRAIASVVTCITSICGRTSTHSVKHQAILENISLSKQPSAVIQKNKRAYNVLKRGRSVKEITQDEALTVIYSVVVEKKPKTIETVLKSVKKLSNKDKTTLVQIVENKALLHCTPLSGRLNEQHTVRLERLKQVLLS